MTTEQVATKPPIQVAGVVGIAAAPVTMRAAPPQRVDWRRVAALPPFQMFMAERRPGSMAGRDSFAAALEGALTLAAQDGDVQLMDEYSVWHHEKGLWNKESPLGVPKE